ncbi:U2 small nuclear ribonucleoprotein auxiliary factor 35 kDa subunit-related protein 2 isoform X1 [Lampetra planeri]
MAADTGEVEAVVGRLSHKCYRALLRKEKRRRKRQDLARQRNEGEEEEEEEELDEVQKAKEEREERRIEAEVMRAHLEWQKRERQAQEEFQQQQARTEEERRRREEEERKIKEEWENQQAKEKEEKERKEAERRTREEAIHKLLEDSDKQAKGRGAGEDWRNPDAPRDYGTERDRAHCPFFLKTGACRFGDRCSRLHVRPSRSATLLLRSMFAPFGLDQARCDDYDSDAGLELGDDDLRRQFRDFYRDALPELRRPGRVRQFKVSCNFEPHLRGNVYVQYETEEEAVQAFQMFNGRWYAGRQINCEFCPVSRWKSAICGLYDRRRCPKGKSCNFLHVFQNPGNEFWEADHDLEPRSPESHRGGTGSSRRDRTPPSNRHDRQRRHRSRSAERGSAAAAASSSSSSLRRGGRTLPSAERTTRRDDGRLRWSERRSERSPAERRARSRSWGRSERFERSERSERSERTERSARMERSERSPSGGSRRRSPGTRRDSSSRHHGEKRDGRRSGSRESRKDDKTKNRKKNKKEKNKRTKEEEEERREGSRHQRRSEGPSGVEEASIGTETPREPVKMDPPGTVSDDGLVPGGSAPTTNGCGGNGDRGSGNHGDEEHAEEGEEAPLRLNGSDGVSGERGAADVGVFATSPEDAAGCERSQVAEKARQEEDVSREVDDTVQWILES